MGTVNYHRYPSNIPKVIHRFCGKARLCSFSGLILACLLSGCASQPANLDNLCAIFSEKRSWYQSAKRSEKKWGVPLQIPMAMMYQESKFVSDAKPPMKKVLGFIPVGRGSSSYGYSQAKRGTWKDYKRETGNSGADRNNFSDAIDFMGWFVNKTHEINKVSKWDTREQYLNYHEGWGGYRKQSYRNKTWLLGVADRVNGRASQYGEQYRGCKKELNAGWFRRTFL